MSNNFFLHLLSHLVFPFSSLLICWSQDPGYLLSCIVRITTGLLYAPKLRVDCTKPFILGESDHYMIGGGLKHWCLPLLFLPPALFCFLMPSACSLSLYVLSSDSNKKVRLFLFDSSTDWNYSSQLEWFFFSEICYEWKDCFPMLVFTSEPLSRLWHSLLGLLQIFPQPVRGWITSRSSSFRGMLYCISTTPPSFPPLQSKCTGQWVIVAVVILDLSFNKQMTFGDHHMKNLHIYIVPYFPPMIIL